jgi:hypothetical protein
MAQRTRASAHRLARCVSEGKSPIYSDRLRIRDSIA